MFAINKRSSLLCSNINDYKKIYRNVHIWVTMCFLVCENQRFNLRWSWETLCELFASHFATILSFNFIYNLTPIVSVLKHFYSSLVLRQSKLEGLSLANIFALSCFCDYGLWATKPLELTPLLCCFATLRQN